jgi:hypothetical protein
VVRGVHGLVVLLSWAAPVVVRAQVTRSEYYWQIPPAARIVGETQASARLQLFGSPTSATTDTAPADGIDDARAARLSALAERFSPIVKRNNFSVPRDFRTIEGMRLTLNVDRWVEGHRVERDSIDLGEASTRTDDRLLELLRAFDPRRQVPLVRDPGEHRETILYLDFPGDGESSWRRAHRRHDPRRSSIAMHPFVHEDSTLGDARFTLVLQYWFFYPFNDGGNNHEGDWEHINVALTTRQRARDLRGELTEPDVRRLFEHDASIPLDSITISWVAYYFHHQVMRIDYLAPERPHDCADCPSRRRGSPMWEDPRFVPNVLRRRLALADGRLATHPFVYLGGNGRGPDELLSVVPRFGASFNRNPNGSYPFPGTWRTIGPLDATEQVTGSVEPPIRRRAREGADSIPWYDLLDDDHYVTYRAPAIRLLPDWERVVDAMHRDAGLRREWAWLVLPIHFGFPATRSPGGGAIPRTDLGNVAPFGPAYSAAWNRPFETAAHHGYDPHVLRVVFAPTSPLSGLQNGWGILNVPLALSGLIPGVQVTIAQLAPWATGALGVLGSPPGKTFYPGELPHRFTSFGVGPYTQFRDEGLARLLPHDDDAVVAAALASGSARGAHVDGASFRRSNVRGMRAWMILHYGDRWAMENSFAIDTGFVSYDITDSSGVRLGRVNGSLTMRQLSGGARFSNRFLHDDVRLFGRGGYTWSWWTVRGASLDGQPLERPRTKGGHVLSFKPSKDWWPNSVYGGAGIELFAPRRAWLAGALGYGITAELTVHAYPLRAHRCHCLLERADGALTLVFGW